MSEELRNARSAECRMCGKPEVRNDGCAERRKCGMLEERRKCGTPEERRKNAAQRVKMAKKNRTRERDVERFGNCEVF